MKVLVAMDTPKPKRVTVKLSCPNPLFEKWLTEWRDEAKQSQSKMQYCFSLALKSLQKYPLPLQTGKDCKVLCGFGNKLCKMLDDKLLKYRSSSNTDILQTVNLASSSNIINSPNGKSVVGKTSENKKQKLTRTPSETKQKLTRTPSGTLHEYIPKYGSGSFAILVALYKLSLEPEYLGYSAKSNVIRIGQPLCNSSFTTPEPGSRYTAWSSMRTLLEKKLVTKNSNPAKFSLTDQGILLAHKLYTKSRNVNNTATVKSDNQENIFKMDTSEITDVIDKKPISKLGNLEKCELIDLTEECSSSQSEMMLPKCFSEHQIEIPGSNIPSKQTSSSSLITKQASTSSLISKQTSNSSLIATQTSNSSFLSNQNSGSSLFTKQTSSSSLLSKQISSSSLILKQNSGSSRISKKTASSSSLSLKCSSEENVKTANSNVITSKQTSSSSLASSQSNSSCEEDTFFMLANSFEIILLVDTQETSGSKAQLEDPILIELSKLKVNFEVRHLKVGDYVWICRDRATNAELVLPYIVERKRMDDFGKSIKDGRFHEQKFRLKQCGLQNPVYLIESYGNNEHYIGLPITTLYQAATNTLVQDKFSVKFTDNLKGTAHYLSQFTLLLRKYFVAKTFMSCSRENLTPSTFEDDLIPLMTFKEFSKGAQKNKQLKVKDLFVRQLLQIKGMSVDRAVAIVAKYPTPKNLKMAYDATSSSEAEKLLAPIQYGKLKKNIGVVLSKTVFQLYTLTSF